MTLLKKDREKVEIEVIKRAYNLKAKGFTVEEIARGCNLTKEEVLKILK